LVSKQNNRHAQQNRKYSLPTPHEIRCKFAYRPHTGEIVTKRGVVGYLDKDDYLICVFSVKPHVRLRAHQIAFVLMRGYWPEQINHINGDKSDNRWQNLEECNSSENLAKVRVNKCPSNAVKVFRSRKLYKVQFNREEKKHVVYFTLWRDAFRFNAKLNEGIRQHGAGFTLPVPPKSERIKPHMRSALRKTKT